MLVGYLIELARERNLYTEFIFPQARGNVRMSACIDVRIHPDRNGCNAAGAIGEFG